MCKVTIYIALLGLAVLGRLSAEDASKKKAIQPTWTVRGVEVSKAQREEELLLSGQGTRLEFELRLETGTIVGLDRKATKIRSFTDNKGTDLLAKPSEVNSVGSMSVSDDGKSASMNFQAHGIPVPGATKLHLKGSVAVLLGKDEKTLETKVINLATGTDLEIGKLGKSKIFPQNALEFVGNRPLKNVVLKVARFGKFVPAETLKCYLYPSYGSNPDAKNEYRYNIHWSARW